jgi:uncharacterized protein YndB with AHSA1/START domain
VWRALTDSKLLASWLMENDLKPVLGHTFDFRSKPMGDWDGVVHCQVLEVVPNEKLSYSWRGGSGKTALDTIVTWTLTPNGAGTRLHLEHTGFTEGATFAYEAMGRGWREKLADLAKLSEL